MWQPRGHVGQRQRRGVRAQERVVAHLAGGVAEDLAFEFEVLGHGFEHDVGAGEARQRRRSSVRLLRAEAQVAALGRVLLDVADQVAHDTT